jgi:TPR repeat protein
MMLTDAQLVTAYISEGKEQYLYAKGVYSIAPKASLTELRGLLHLLIRQLGEHIGIEELAQKLGENISILRKSRLVNPAITDMIYDIKKRGDQAAHPETFTHMSHDDFVESAKDALNSFCELIALIRLSVLGVTENEFEFIIDDASELRELTYAALFTDDCQAKFRVAKALIEHETKKILEANSSVIYLSNSKSDVYLGLMKEAAYGGCPEAKLDMGLILLHGVDLLGIDPSDDAGRIFMFLREASLTLPEAKAVYALELMNAKRHGYDDVDAVNDAIELLVEAAEDESPDALYALAEFYSDGRHVQRDAGLAMSYLEKAVSLGFPNAQYKIGTLLVETQQYDEAISYFDKAIDQGFAEAGVAKGELLFQLGDFEAAIEAYSIYVTAPYVDKPECKILVQLKIYECLITLAGNDLLKLQDILYKVVMTMGGGDYSKSDYKVAETICKPVLKKLRGKLQPVNEDQSAALVLSFKKDGSLRRLTETFELMGELADQSGILRLPKDIYPLINKAKNIAVSKARPGRNEPCTCGSGKKYKFCCFR